MKVVLSSNVAGYLPMTPGVDSPGQVGQTVFVQSCSRTQGHHVTNTCVYIFQAAWPSRSRLNSARTVSESSEGCEMNEDLSLTGSLGRRRHREDSAYMSQRDSMSGGPPDTPSPEMEEEDQNGYVLPGDSPERGDSLRGLDWFPDTTL